MQKVLSMRNCFGVLGLFILAACAGKTVSDPAKSSLKAESALENSSKSTDRKEGDRPENSAKVLDPITIPDIVEEPVKEGENVSPDSEFEAPDSGINSSHGKSSAESNSDSYIQPGKVQTLAEQAKRVPFESTDTLQDIYFGFDRFNLSKIAQDTLRKNVEWLKKNSSVKAQLEGHCDIRGTNNYNLSLGSRRANSVKNMLVSLGIPEARLSTISYGEEKPACLENGETCWSKNRRVHFLVSSD